MHHLTATLAHGFSRGILQAHGEAHQFLSAISALGMKQHVTKPTHRSGHTLDLLRGQGGRVGITAWPLLDGGSDRRGFDPRAGKICYGSFL